MLYQFLNYLPIDLIDYGQTTQKLKKARIFILAYDTHFDKLSSPIKFHYTILYGSRVMSIFLTDFVCRQFVKKVKPVCEKQDIFKCLFLTRNYNWPP